MTASSKRRELADELVRARVRAGLTGRDMARALGLSQAQLYRYDHAVTTPSVPKVRQWLDTCRAAAAEAASDEHRARILALAEQAHAEPRSWKMQRDAAVVSPQEQAAGQEIDASEVSAAEFVVVPGLLQTPEYAAAVVRRADLHGQFDHSVQVVGRLARQPLLFEPGRRWKFLLAERLLSWSPGSPALMGPQRARLLSLVESAAVEIAVLPSGAVIEPAGLWWCPFTIVRPRGGDRFVVMELPHAEVTVTAADEVASFELLWTRMWASAARGDDAIEMIRNG